MESIIGKRYIPTDNSWSVNLTSAGDAPYKSEQGFLAGTNDTFRKENVIIASEPFLCIVKTEIIEITYQEQLMIIVNYNNQSYSILYNEQNVIK